MLERNESLVRISAIIATKNNVSTIKECLDSLVSYSKTGYINEIIVVDAKSNDGTLDLIKEYPVILLSDNGSSLGSAYNIGWKRARGKFLLFLDADALLGKNFFPQVEKYFESPNVGIVGCLSKTVAANRISKTVGEWSLGKQRASANRFWELVSQIGYGGKTKVLSGGPCYMVRRVCLQSIGGFTEDYTAEDIILFMRLMREGWAPYYWIDSPVYHYARSTLRGVISEYYRFGVQIAKMQIREQKENYRTYGVAFNILVRLLSPAMAIIFAVHFRNLLHLILYPVTRAAWLLGYVRSALRQ